MSSLNETRCHGPTPPDSLPLSSFLDSCGEDIPSQDQDPDHRQSVSLSSNRFVESRYRFFKLSSLSCSPPESQGVNLEPTQAPLVTQAFHLQTQQLWLKQQRHISSEEEIYVDEDEDLIEAENVIPEEIVGEECPNDTAITLNSQVVDVGYSSLSCRDHVDHRRKLAMNEIHPSLEKTSSRNPDEGHEVASSASASGADFPTSMSKKIKLEPSTVISQHSASDAGNLTQGIRNAQDQEEMESNLDISGASAEFSRGSSIITSRPPSLVQLLNRPPRLGLSKLEKKLSILHEISIIESEE